MLIILTSGGAGRGMGFSVRYRRAFLMANFSVGRDFPAIFCFSPGTCLQGQDIEKHLSLGIPPLHVPTKSRKRLDVTQINSNRFTDLSFICLPVILPFWVQGAACTWTESTPFPRRLNSHLQSACWGKLLSCTRRWPEERRHLVRTALSSSSDWGKGTAQSLERHQGCEASRVQLEGTTIFYLTDCCSDSVFPSSNGWTISGQKLSTSQYPPSHFKGNWKDIT